MWIIWPQSYSSYQICQKHETKCEVLQKTFLQEFVWQKVHVGGGEDQHVGGVLHQCVWLFVQRITSYSLSFHWYFFAVFANIRLMVDEQTEICQAIGEYIIIIMKHHINTNKRNLSYFASQIFLTLISINHYGT